MGPLSFPQPIQLMGSYSITTSGVSNTAFVLILLSSIPSLWRLAKRTRRVKATNEPALYEDEDGAATKESQALYSTKRQFTAIFVLVGLGLVTSLGLAIVAIAREHELNYSRVSRVQLWLLFPSWVTLHRPTRNFNVAANQVFRSYCFCKFLIQLWNQT